MLSKQKAYGGILTERLPNRQLALHQLLVKKMPSPKWVKEDRTAKALLTHRIPDSTLIRVHSRPSLKDRWDLIIKEYSSKGAFAQADLRSPSLPCSRTHPNHLILHCGRPGAVRRHFIHSDPQGAVETTKDGDSDEG
jgi:hypothetical protein